MHSLEQNLRELCALAPLRETRPRGLVSRKGAKAQSSKRLMINVQIRNSKIEWPEGLGTFRPFFLFGL
jgi:hypothetical protein